MAVYHISLRFAQASDNTLDDIGDNVLTKMKSNANFATPDPALEEIAGALDTFRSTMAAMKQGGTAATLARDNARAALISLLRQLALYVEKTAGGDPVKLLSSGFDITSSNHAPVALAKPAIQGIDFGATGSVILHCGAMNGARFLKGQYRTNGGNWVDGPTSTQARNIPVPGLASGTMYDFRVQAGAGQQRERVERCCQPHGGVAGNAGSSPTAADVTVVNCRCLPRALAP